MLKEFKEFIARANIFDLAVAVIIGVAFGKVVTSLVEGIIMPPIGLLLGKVDFASLFVVLDQSKGVPASLAEAKAKGIPVVASRTTRCSCWHRLARTLAIETMPTWRHRPSSVSACASNPPCWCCPRHRCPVGPRPYVKGA